VSAFWDSFKRPFAQIRDVLERIMFGPR